MASRQTKSVDEKQQPTKILKARPVPNFSQLHSRWTEKLNREKEKSKKPTTTFQTAVKAGPVQNASNFKSLIPRPPRPVSSAANHVQSQPPRVKIKSKKAAQGQEGMEFKAEPESLRQILNTANTATETSRRPRESIYDRMSRKFKASEIEAGRTVSMFSMPRTPLGDLGNYPALQSPPRTARKSIYEKLSQMQSAKRSAQTARRMEKLASDSVKRVTWSTKLSPYKNSLEDDAIKQKLFDEPNTDQPKGDGLEVNEATMKKILQAEKMLEAKMKNCSDNVEMDDSENSYKPASSVPQFTYRQSTARLPTPSPPASNLDQTQAGSNLLPTITGIGPLPHTPGHDDTLCTLANNLNLKQNYQQDGSPVLPPPTRQSPAEEVCVETCKDSPRQSQDVEKPPFIENQCHSPEKLAATTIVSDQQTDNITLSLQSVDNELKKSRRRSAALLTQPSLASVEHELQQILAQQKILDERRRILQEMLDCQCPSTASGISQSLSARVSPSTRCQTSSSSGKHGESLGNRDVKDVSIVAQAIDGTLIESPDQADLTFHITPEDVGGEKGLQAASTALPSIKETSEREIDFISQHSVSSAVNHSQPHQFTNRYEQALLDEETSLYTCTMTYDSALARRRQLSDPVGQLLSFGDDQHFIPISEH